VEKSDIDQLAANEREWRAVMLQQIDTLYKKVDMLDQKITRMDKEMATFKVKVFAFATMFGGGSGYAANLINKLFTGG